MARLANLVPKSAKSFDPRRHLTRGDVAVSSHGLLVTFKVTVHLQGCLAWKRLSASGLRYLNHYIKLKLIGRAIRLYQQFRKKKNCRIFHDLWMRAPESPFERYMSKRILFFAYLMCSSVSRAKALKKKCLRFPISQIQFQWKVTEHFWKRIKKTWSDRTRIAVE